MKDSSNRLTIGVIIACMVVIVACLIVGRLRRGEPEKTAASGRTPAVSETGREVPPEETRELASPPVLPEEKTGSPAPPEILVLEEFDITGTVVDKGSKPIGEATVKVAFYSLKNFSMESGTGIQESKPLEQKTKEDGRFGFKYEEGNRYVLSVEKEDYVPVAENLAEPRRDMVITLTLGGAIEGKVVDAVTLKPLDKFRIMTSQETGSAPGMSFFKKKEIDIHLQSEGKEFSSPEGKFRVSGLSEGEYRVTSLAEGYAQSYKSGVDVKAEKTTSGILIKQQPEGGISGHVVDAIGKPIGGATIVQKNPLRSELFGELRLPQQKVLATSDPKGEFRIGGLPAGTFTLQARHTDYCPAEKEVRVNKGETTQGVEFQLVQGGRISGVVLAKVDLQPIPEATVKASTASTFIIPAMGEAEAKTDQNGMFDIIKLEPGTYTLTVSAADFAGKTIENLKVGENQAITNLIIELSQGGSLVGTVKNLSGKPMANVMVFAVGAAGQKVSQTDSQGNYAIKNLKEGAYMAGAVEVSGLTGFGAGRSDSYLVRIENDKETRLDIVAGGSLRVYGKVTQDGEPQAGVIVAIESTSKSVAFSKQSRSATGKTDEEGLYEIKDVQPGQYNLTVMKAVAMMPRRILTTEIELTNSDLEKNIELPGGGIAGKVMDAESHRPIEGAKVSLERKRAANVQEAAITKLGLYVGGTENTDADGKYKFATVEDGMYMVVASKEGYAPQGLTAEVSNSRGPSGLDFSLSAGGTLRGQVRGSDPSRPVKQIFLSVKDSDGNLVCSRKMSLSEEGEYEGVVLGAGEYTVCVDATKYASAYKKVRIQAGAENRADFVLTAGGTLMIRVVDERGKPVQGPVVSLMDEQGSFVLGWFTDLKELMNLAFEAISRADGVDVTENVPEGQYRMKVGGVGYEDQFVNVAVREGEQTDVTVTLRESR